MTDKFESYTPFKKCRHLTLQILDMIVLGASVGCVHCDETFFLAEDVVSNEFYPFRHNSHQGPDHDIVLLVHQKLIDKK